MTNPTTVKEIVLRGASGKIALVDEGDYERISQHKWWLSSHGYAVTRIRAVAGRKHIPLHRLLLDPPPDKEVDHINRNRLDCRRSNLRLATSSQNKFNSPPHKNNTSGYKGVTRVSGGRPRWQAQIRLDRRYRYLGEFDTPEAAARLRRCRKTTSRGICLSKLP